MLTGLNYSKEMSFKISGGGDKTLPEINYTDCDVYQIKTEKDTENKKFEFVLYQYLSLKSFLVQKDKVNYTSYNFKWDYIQSRKVFQTDTKRYQIEMHYKPFIDQEIRIIRNLSYKDPMLFSLIPIYFDPQMKLFKAEFELSDGWDMNITIRSLFDSTHFTIVKTDKGYSVTSDTLSFTPDLKLFDQNIPYAYLACDLFYKGKKVISPDPDIYKQYIQDRYAVYKAEFKFFTEEIFLDESRSDKTKIKEIKNHHLKDTKRNQIIKESCKQMSESAKIKYRDLYHQLETDTCEFDKVNRILKYVQKNIRYIAKSDSTHDFEPNHPVDILSNGYGDCKDMSCLIKTISNLFDINIEYALVNTTYDHPEGIASDLLFNHVFCIYRNEGKPFILDATDEYSSLRKIPDYLLNRNIFLIDNSNLNYIKFSPQEEDFQLNVEINANLDSLEICDATIYLKGINRSATLISLEKYRFISRYNYLNSLLNVRFSNITFKNLKISDKSDTVLCIKAVADLSHFAIKNQKKGDLYFNKTPIYFNTNEILMRENDSCPVNIRDYNETRLLIRIYNCFKGISGNNVLLKQNYNKFKAECHFSDDIQSLCFETRILPQTYHQQDKKEFIEFIKEYDKQKKEWFVRYKEDK